MRSTSSGGPCTSKQMAVVVSGGSGVVVLSVASMPPPMPPGALRRRSSAVKAPCRPRPCWLRIHASKPAECDICPACSITEVRAFSRIRSSSLATAASCAEMLMPPLRVRDSPPALRSKAPAPNCWTSRVSAPPSVSCSERSYTARFSGSASVSKASCTRCHTAGSPPRSGWLFIARALYAARTSSVLHVRARPSSA